MGDVIGGVVGGSLQNRAGRRAAQEIRRGTEGAISELQPTQERGESASNLIASLMGLSDDPGAGQAALRQFREGTGFQDRLQRGTQAITGSAAARGLLDSGATARALQDRGQQMATESINNFLAQLMGLSQQGVGASGGIANLRSGGAQRAAGARAGGRMAQAESFGNAISGIDLTEIFGGGE